MGGRPGNPVGSRRGKRRFRQFRQLLEIIAARREAGERVESFDLMDFDGYDKLLKQYGWVQRPDEMNTRLCDE